MTAHRAHAEAQRAWRAPMLLAVCLLWCTGIGLSAQDSTGTIRGRVTDLAGHPLASAQVFLAGTSIVATTDTGGFYVLTSVPPSTYGLAATYIGFGQRRIDGIHVLGNQTLEVNVSIERFLTIEGRILGPDGDPVGGAYVSLVGGAGVLSQSDGSYKLRGMQSGVYDLRLLCYGDQPRIIESIELLPDHDLALDLECKSAPLADDSTWWEYGILRDTYWETDSGSVGATSWANLAIRLGGIHDQEAAGAHSEAGLPWVLNALGRDGWELVGFSGNPREFFAIFKRKRVRLPASEP